MLPASSCCCCCLLLIMRDNKAKCHSAPSFVRSSGAALLAPASAFYPLPLLPPPSPSSSPFPSPCWSLTVAQTIVNWFIKSADKLNKKHSHAYNEHKKQLPKQATPPPLPLSPHPLALLASLFLLLLPRSRSSAVAVCFMGSSFRSQLLFKSKQQASLPFPSPASLSHVLSSPLPTALAPALSQSLRLPALATVAMQSGGTASQKLSASFCPATSYTRIYSPLPRVALFLC